MLLYYITDRRQLPGDDAAQRRGLLAKIAAAARAGVDFIQLREKDLSARELEQLARDAVARIRETRNEEPGTRFLLNSRTDIALATGAAGVHLPAHDLPASEVRALWGAAAPGRSPVLAVSCHTLAEVLAAESHGADFAVFGPVFEKDGKEGAGLKALRAVCHRGSRQVPRTESGPALGMPVLALGGVTLESAAACIAAGAAGVAGIRLFQQHDIAAVVSALRGMNGRTKAD